MFLVNGMVIDTFLEGHYCKGAILKIDQPKEILKMTFKFHEVVIETLIGQAQLFPYGDKKQACGQIKLYLEARVSDCKLNSMYKYS